MQKVWVSWWFAAKSEMLMLQTNCELRFQVPLEVYIKWAVDSLHIFKGYQLRINCYKQFVNFNSSILWNPIIAHLNHIKFRIMPNEHQMNNRLHISKGGNQLPAAHSCARGGPCKSSKVTIQNHHCLYMSKSWLFEWSDFPNFRMLKMLL